MRDVSDLYNLTTGDLIPLTAEKSKSAKQAEKIIKEIQDKKHRPFWRLINALGIRYVGEATAQVLAQHLENLEDLMRASKEDLLQVEGVGEQVAASIVEYFQNQNNQELLRKLREAGVQEEKSKPGRLAPWRARPSSSPAGSPTSPGRRPNPR